MSEYTPAMQQYINLKKQNEDCILFFRLGDFYEVFFEDAKLCNRILDIILTSKNKNATNPIPMAGIPHHSADKYINKLISLGHKVAIAEQITEPQPGKIIQRQVTSIITPGTHIIDGDKELSNILSITFCPQKNGTNYHISRGDFSIGEYYTNSIINLEQIEYFLLTIKPKEIILDIDCEQKNDISNFLKNRTNLGTSSISTISKPLDITSFIKQQLQIQTLSSYGNALMNYRETSFGILLNYLLNTQKKEICINRISYYAIEKKIMLDEITIKNLELFTSSYESNEKYSLIGIIDNMQTSGGSRLIRNVLSNPTNNIQEIKKRLNNIDYYNQNINKTIKIQKTISNIQDISKLITKIIYKKSSIFNFIKLRKSLQICIQEDILKELMFLGIDKKIIDDTRQMYEILEKTFKTDEDVGLETNKETDYIKDGYNNQIDNLKQLAFNSDKLLIEYQQELIKLSNIQNIKIKYIKNQGYYIETTNKDIKQLEKIIDINNSKLNLIRRSTLKGGQRYISDYLDNIQIKVIKAKDELKDYESKILDEIKQNIIQNNSQLQEIYKQISRLDLYCGQAILSKNKFYTKPEITNNGTIKISGGRHPIIEEYVPLNETFIPNDLEIEEKNIHIITGPNMGGKSTYLRQNAIIVLMAHCGLYVPAQKAEISLLDGIFARIGSGDIIAKNQSTFMTEMIEVVNILNNSTKNSFVIFDELGRGTSTYDGLALTKSILEYINEKIGCKTLIATHYHELIKMEDYIKNIKNFSVSVYENNKNIIFMKKIKKGGANKSYGIDVAKLAGINDIIIQKAKQHLQELENKRKDFHQDNGLFCPKEIENTNLLELQKINALLQSIDINNITPLQSLQILSKIKNDIMFIS